MTGRERADFVAGLRAVADLVEAGQLPLPTYALHVTGSLAGGWPTDAARSLARMQLAADLLGVQLTTVPVGDDLHHNAAAAFGPVEVNLSFVEHDAAKDIARGVGEVVGPVEGSGSATAPTESAAGVEPSPADEAPEAVAQTNGGASAAVPAPVEGGDGAAVTPDVWVARRRRGIHFHQTDGQWGADYTGCGRAARPNGNRIPLTEATGFGAVPCPRCYGTEG